MDQTREPAVLDAHECWRLLGTVPLGRLAIPAAEGQSPDVFPINYRVHENCIVFRTAAGAKYAAVTSNAAVTLEADSVNSETGMAWSVVAKGRASETSLHDSVANAADRLLFAWEPGSKEHIVRIDVDTITGRQFKIQRPDASGLSLDESVRAGLE